MIDRTNEIKRVLITGACGSAGRFLADYLRREQPQVEVHGTARRVHSRTPVPGATLHEADLADTASLLRVVQSSEPDVIYHCGANPDKGFEIPSAIIQNNLVGTANLLEAIRLIRSDASEWLVKASGNLNPIFVMVSSSEVYGAVTPEDVPIKESCPFRPVSPYAVSKVGCDHLARIYHKAYGMRTIVTRAFTYLNPLRPDLFASSFAKQIAEIEVGKRDVLKHGNLDSTRVLMAADDMARAYWLAATRGRFGEAYNIGGCEPVTVGGVLNSLISFTRLREIKREQDPALLRPTDVTMQIPDCSKFKADTGWECKIDIDAALLGLLEHYRKEVRKG